LASGPALSRLNWTGNWKRRRDLRGSSSPATLPRCHTATSTVALATRRRESTHRSTSPVRRLLFLSSTAALPAGHAVRSCLLADGSLERPQNAPPDRDRTRSAEKCGGDLRPRRDDGRTGQKRSGWGRKRNEATEWRVYRGTSGRQPGTFTCRCFMARLDLECPGQLRVRPAGRPATAVYPPTHRRRTRQAAALWSNSRRDAFHEFQNSKLRPTVRAFLSTARDTIFWSFSLALIRKMFFKRSKQLTLIQINNSFFFLF
jgi:hypothetical protein